MDDPGSSRVLLLSKLLGDLPLSEFLEQHWLREPIARASGSPEVTGLGSWERVRRLVETADCDLLCVRDGAVWKGARPATFEAARALFADGYSLALRQPDLHDEALAKLGRTLSAELSGTINLHVYCTPSGHGSFGWHYDPEEVFIFQTVGRKRYTLRENTVNPAPLLETLGNPSELKKETSPEREVELGAGDWLYIPGGYWHATHALEDAVSISVGLLPPSPIAVLDFMRAELLRDPSWRRRFPPFGHASPLSDPQKMALAQQTFTELAETLNQRMRQPSAAVRFFAAYMLASLSRRPSPPQPLE